MKCFVDVCPNDSTQGKFYNFCCMPCYRYALAIASAKQNGDAYGSQNSIIHERLVWIADNLVDTLQHCILERYDETTRR